MKRRSFCLNVGAAVGTVALAPKISWGMTAGEAFSLENVHESAAQAARTLAAGRQVQLTVLLPQGSLANVEPVALAFGKATGINFKFVEAAVDDINSQMIIDTIAGANAFDLALPATFGLPDLAEAGAIANLEVYSHKYEPSDFQTDALFALGDYYQDNLYGYQTDGDAYLMFYNRDWLEDGDEQKRFADAHGYELGIPETWQQLDAAMAFFHRPDENRFGGALFRTPSYIAWEFWIRFHAKGFWPFDENLEPQIANDAGVAALEELLAASSSLYPSARSHGLFENWEAFGQGNMFCNIGWGGTQKFLNQEGSPIKGRLAFGPTPGGQVKGELLSVPYFNWGWNYTVSAGSQNPEIAYLFALFASSPEMSTVAVRENGFFDPFRSKHYADPQIVEAYTAEFLEVHRSSMARSIPDLYLKGQGEYFDALRENLALADAGKIDAKESLRRTVNQWNQTTRRLGKTVQIEQWGLLRQRYPDDVRKVLT